MELNVLITHTETLQVLLKAIFCRFNLFIFGEKLSYFHWFNLTSHFSKKMKTIATNCKYHPTFHWGAQRA